MPSDTFHNLPADKRDRFVEAALDEFVAHPYDQASITRLVQELGIAKGSVYQYFGSKADLFCWLVEESGRHKLAALGLPGATLPPAADPFDELAGLYASGLRFWRDQPRWARLGLRALEPTAEPRVAALRDQLRTASLAWLTAWLDRAQQSGAIRLDAPASQLAPLVHGLLSDGLLAAVLAEAGVDLAHLPEGPLPVSDAVLEGIVHTALGLLRSGLGAPQPT